MKMRLASLHERWRYFNEDALTEFAVLETPRVQRQSAVRMNLLDLVQRKYEFKLKIIIRIRASSIEVTVST